MASSCLPGAGTKLSGAGTRPLASHARSTKVMPTLFDQSPAQDCVGMTCSSPVVPMHKSWCSISQVVSGWRLSRATPAASRTLLLTRNQRAPSQSYLAQEVTGRFANSVYLVAVVLLTLSFHMTPVSTSSFSIMTVISGLLRLTRLPNAWFERMGGRPI